MTETAVFECVVSCIRDLLPELNDHDFRQEDSLEALGANSIDRAEIITSILRELSLNVPAVQLARIPTIGELAARVYAEAKS